MTRLIDEMFVTEMEPHMFDIMLGTADADFLRASGAPRLVCLWLRMRL